MPLTDRDFRNFLVHGLGTNQLSTREGKISFTGETTPAFIGQMSAALRDPIIVYPQINQRDFNDYVVLDERFEHIVVEFLPEITAAIEAINDKYRQIANILGNPKSSLRNGAQNGFYRNFTNGAIYVSPSGDVHEVHGAIYHKYVSLRAEAGFLGYPLTDERPTTLDTGRYNEFQGGSIYWSPETGAWEVHGLIRDKWIELGADRSHLGFPISDEENEPQSGGRVSHFQYGSVFFQSGSPIRVYNDSVTFNSRLSGAYVQASVELSMNSAGDWHYTGRVQNNAIYSSGVSIASTPQFQDSNGNIFVCKIEHHLGGSDIGDNDYEWDHVGKQEPFIRENWPYIRFAGIRTVMKIDVTFGDVLLLIAAGLPIAIGVVIFGAIVSGGKVCPPQGHMRRDPYTGEDSPVVTFEVVDENELCPPSG